MTKQLDKGMEFYERMCSSGIAEAPHVHATVRACAEQPDEALQRALMLCWQIKARDIELYEGDFAALVRSCTAAGAEGRAACQQIVLPEMMDYATLSQQAPGTQSSSGRHAFPSELLRPKSHRSPRQIAMACAAIGCNRWP